MDIGQYSIKVGYAGEDSPRSEINTMIGIHDSLSTMVDQGPSTSNQVTATTIKERKYYIDTTQIMVPRGGQEARSFFNNGISKFSFCLVSGFRIFY